MIKSMTGYGRFEDVVDGRTVMVEIKSVNHRFFEFSCRTPRSYGFLEEKLKTLLSKTITRGKVDVFVTVDSGQATASQVEINHALASAYVSALREMCKTYNLKDDISATAVSRYDGVLTVHKEPENEEEIWAAVRIGAEKALADFMSMRTAEGEKLRQDVSTRMHTILSLVEKIEERSPCLVEEYKNRMYTRLSEILKDKSIDEQRILTEAAIFADKIAVDEETVRLRSHFAQMEQMLDSSDPVGRKMDFILQEMNREANTIGSKICDATLAHVVVEIKAELEKIREQIQNIE
ncbi:MAG: YicC/YloC family endoribonuclease [Acutalibacteraceae bacterium]